MAATSMKCVGQRRVMLVHATLTGPTAAMRGGNSENVCPPAASTDEQGGTSLGRIVCVGRRAIHRLGRRVKADGAIRAAHRDSTGSAALSIESAGGFWDVGALQTLS